MTPMSVMNAIDPHILQPRDFDRLAALVQEHSGIRMPDHKKTMMEGRLRRRVRALGLDGVSDYCRYLFDKGGLEREFSYLIDSMTTNKTDFFREPRHFQLLADRVVPQLVQEGTGRTRPLRLWSAASSTGPEAYSAAMVLADVAAVRPGFDFQVFGTDISSDVLETAVRATYPEDLIEPVPLPLRKRYLLRARDPRDKTVRIAAELRRKVRFARLNLLEAVYPWGDPMDVTFCRNVLIYFDKPTQQRVLDFLCDHLRPGGWLFLGHSETLSNLRLPVLQVAPSTYRRL